MKLTIQRRHLRRNEALDEVLRQGLRSLEPRLQIEEARVWLECAVDASPAFRARVHLVTPGPDVHAESQDHTLQAAVRKVLLDLETRIGDRAQRRVWRQRSKRPVSARVRRECGRQSAKVMS